MLVSDTMFFSQLSEQTTTLCENPYDFLKVMIGFTLMELCFFRDDSVARQTGCHVVQNGSAIDAGVLATAAILVAVSLGVPALPLCATIYCGSAMSIGVSLGYLSPIQAVSGTAMFAAGVFTMYYAPEEDRHGQLISKKGDASSSLDLNFQSPASDIMAKIIDLHDDLMFFLVLILLFVS
jgi:hypothetical protein